MAARNYISMMMKNIKAVGFDSSVVSQYAKAHSESFSILQYLKGKGIKTDVLVDAPSVFEALENYFECNPEEILYVGDKAQDIKSANKAGLISVLLDRSRKNLQFGQQISVDSLDELQDYL